MRLQKVGGGGNSEVGRLLQVTAILLPACLPTLTLNIIPLLTRENHHQALSRLDH